VSFIYKTLARMFAAGVISTLFTAKVEAVGLKLEGTGVTILAVVLLTLALLFAALDGMVTQRARKEADHEEDRPA
jgi:hypothetical protein